MTSVVIKQIPNALTTLRLLLAVPICLLILKENYSQVLWIALIAGVSDAVDGWLARKLKSESRYGSIVDPLSDKALLISGYLAFAIVGLLPWWVAVLIVTRDAVIVCGALVYYGIFGSYEVSPSIWGKTSTTVQMVFALMLLMQQVYPLFPALSFNIGLWLLVFMAIVSGCHYVYIWGCKALNKQNHID